jgi:L-xylulokinase
LKNYLLGIDAGSSSVKSVLFNREGNMVASSSQLNKYPKATEETKSLGIEEIDANSIWESTKTCIKNVIRESGIDSAEIAAVGICSFGNGIVTVDKSGNPAANAVFSLDHRASKIMEDYQKEGSLERINEIIAGTLFAGEPGPILRWYKENRPDIYNNIGCVFMCKDFLIFKLTGMKSGDINCFGGSSMMDLKKFSYSKELMDLYGIPEMYSKLPTLHKSCEIAGTVSKEAAAATGLVCGTPVSAGMMDILACLVGAGAASEGIATIVAGTWCINETQSTKIIPGASANQPALEKGLYLNCSYTGASAINYDWFIQALGGTALIEAQNRNISKYRVLDEIIGGMSPDKTDVIFHPFVAQPSVHTKAKAGFFNIDHNTSYKEMVYAVAEGVVFLHKWHINFLTNAGCTIKLARLTGGIAQSSEWAQLFADVLQIPVEVVESSQVGALGSAITAGIAANVYKDYQDGFKHAVRIKARYEPSDKYTDYFEKNYSEWKQLINVMIPYWNRK